jgi:hypothetical protein
MSWIAGGVFTTMIHLVRDNATSMCVNERRYWWSVCNHACVPIPPEHDPTTTGIPWCPTCFPDRDAVEAAQATWTTTTSTETGPCASQS